jgi:hypothetical protein
MVRGGGGGSLQLLKFSEERGLIETLEISITLEGSKRRCRKGKFQER